ncbi:MAG TPA: trypsin-like peptidase domain-containing protein [Syntrophorhabdaceae bacterium]|nr:trypsin-like peptidase domain-containing protein [Syntrophorhabdaceae bacterium]HQM82778.1 trypsin-like peptidase domain-containing protein [Syntrophorhabdaceae bacterium]
MNCSWLIIISAILLVIPSLEVCAMNEAFLNSTVLVTFSANPGNASAGTGFLMSKEIEKGKGHIFLVTNVHAIPPEGSTKNMSIRVMTKSGETVVVKSLEVPVLGTDGKYLPTVKLHPKKGFDVTAINITESVVKEHIEAAWIPYDLLATKDKLKAEGITVGDEIFLLGYPDAIYDPRNVHPILREGVIASVPTEDYAFNDALKKRYSLPDQISGFLIDANVFPGSSGSLVILKQQATTIGSHGETIVSRAKKIPYVLGIVSGSIPIIDVALGSVQRMGLGVVYSYSTIKETIDLFYK